MNELKERLRADLNAAIRARDQVRLRALRMTLTSITNEEVSGDTARELSVSYTHLTLPTTPYV